MNSTVLPSWTVCETWVDNCWLGVEVRGADVAVLELCVEDEDKAALDDEDEDKELLEDWDDESDPELVTLALLAED